MQVQRAIESVINQLAHEFLIRPYRFFTEADAVARFHQMLEDEPLFNRTMRTADGYETGLCHREYPTFFRFADKKPTERLGPPARRGHYDTVILNPAFVTAHPAVTVANRDIRAPRDETIWPFQAVVEFKLDNVGWSAGRARGAVAELDKLLLSEEAPLCYFVVLMRYSAPTLTRWRRYWPMVREEAKSRPEIRSLFAINWLSVTREREFFRLGHWTDDTPHGVTCS